jgi:L-histidine Nalpha-methyltransferase
MTPLDGFPSPASCRQVAETPSHAGCPFLTDAIDGLGATPKRLSPKYFYDRAGSLLFDAICDLPEYYVTRTERSILEQKVDEIANRLGGPCRVVEPGAGSGTKTRLLLRALGPERCVAYVPVDIAGEHLEYTARDLRRDLPWLKVTPFAADFTVDLPLPTPQGHAAARTVVYFPGSTIGNFDPADAERLLSRFRGAAGPDGLVLLGVDLKKDPAVLHAAYNDAEGVTAEFNKNVLRRMNSELGANFEVDAFDHYAFYAPLPGRIEMHLVSARRQTVSIGGRVFHFDEGESLCTERSYKDDLRSAERLARAAGLELVDQWLDDDRRFAVLLFRPLLDHARD